jgi:NAD+ synthase
MNIEKQFNESELILDAPEVARVLEGFVREELGKAGFGKAVLGLSGGIDSALAAAIAARALGAENVLGIMMPYKTSNPASQADAEAVAAHLGIPTKLIEITPMVDAYFDSYQPEADGLRRGNAMARNRMIVLFDHSQRDKSLVIGTGNRTEIMLGYSTLFGDSACAVNPVGDLLKAQVWQMAEYYGIPAQVIKKAPSADLWEGQTDEQELGFSYAMADKVITLLMDHRLSGEEVAAYGVELELVKKIQRRIASTQFKRLPPLIAKISSRTVGIDFNYPRDWGK